MSCGLYNSSNFSLRNMGFGSEVVRPLVFHLYSKVAGLILSKGQCHSNPVLISQRSADSRGFPLDTPVSFHTRLGKRIGWVLRACSNWLDHAVLVTTLLW